MANICPKCLANMDIVGRSHRCIEKPTVEFSEWRPDVSTYQYRDPEKRRAYMRDYMRKRRGA